MTFEAEWARCGSWLQAALDHSGNTHDLDHVEAMVREGTAHFWNGRGAAMITQIVRHPNFTALHIWLAGGDLDELRKELGPAAEAWAARHHGCVRATILGREGWRKALIPNGYRPLSRLLVKELN